MGQSGAVAPAVLLATDAVPKAVLDVALPFAAKQLETYGVHASVTAADAPPAKGERPKSEFFPGVAVGVGVAALVFGVGWGAWKLILGRVL